jgi:hypothetical protein
MTKRISAVARGARGQTCADRFMPNSGRSQRHGKLGGGTRKIERRTGMLLARDVTTSGRSSHLTRGTVLVQVQKKGGGLRDSDSVLTRNGTDTSSHEVRRGAERLRAHRQKSARYQTRPRRHPALCAVESTRGKRQAVLVSGEKARWSLCRTANKSFWFPRAWAKNYRQNLQRASPYRICIVWVRS